MPMYYCVLLVQHVPVTHNSVYLSSSVIEYQLLRLYFPHQFPLIGLVTLHDKCSRKKRKVALRFVYTSSHSGLSTYRVGIIVILAGSMTCIVMICIIKKVTIYFGRFFTYTHVHKSTHTATHIIHHYIFYS